METTSAIPKWFWIGLLVIIAVTIIATQVCKSKARVNASETANDLGIVQPNQRISVVEQVAPNVFDRHSDLQLSGNK